MCVCTEYICWFIACLSFFHDCVCVFIYCLCVCVCVCVHACACVHKQSCLQVYTHTQTYVCVYAQILSHTHTLTLTHAHINLMALCYFIFRPELCFSQYFSIKQLYFGWSGHKTTSLGVYAETGMMLLSLTVHVLLIQKHINAMLTLNILPFACSLFLHRWWPKCTR